MDNYTIKGGDGNEYGPVSETVIRQWVNQGRANGQTQTRKNDGDYMPLSSYPEVADLFGGSATPADTLSPGPVGFESAAPAGFEAPSYGAYGGDAGTDNPLVTQLMEPIAKAGFWLKFMAIIQIIAGIFTAITVIGLLFAWLPIWMGILMWQIANRAKEAAISGDRLSGESAQNKTKTLFIIMGVITLLYFLFTIGYIVLIFALGLSDPDFLRQFEQFEHSNY